MGSRRSEYSVPPLLKWSSFGPMPTENSTTVMPFAFARRKCPSSWAMTITLNTMMNRITVVNESQSPLCFDAFYIFIGFCLCLQDLFQTRILYPAVMIHTLFNQLRNG